MSESRRRLILFDIDGTLLASGGAGSRAMALAFAALWKLENGFAGIEFTGRCDRAILRSAIEFHACSQHPFDHDLRRFKRAYTRRLPSTLASMNGTVLPGVQNLLAELAEDPSVTLGLATGNFRAGAALKLRHYDIRTEFRLGGFGDRVEDREGIVAEALRAARRFGRQDAVYVIGDTVHDVTSAKAHGVTAVGVASGTTSAGDLKAAGADYVLETLEGASHIFA